MYKILDNYTSNVRPYQLEPFKGENDSYHYVYCILNLTNGKFYLGKHSTRKLDDGYFASGGPYFRKAVQKYGEKGFERFIVSFHETSLSAFEKESSLITEEMIKSSGCYNQSKGGYGWGCGYNNLNNVRKRNGEIAIGTKLWQEGRHHWQVNGYPIYKAIADGRHAKNTSANKVRVQKEIADGTFHRLGIKPWQNTGVPKEALSVWCRAEEAFDYIQINNVGWVKLGRYLLDNFPVLPTPTYPVSMAALKSMLRYFKKGWIPTQDQTWIDWKNSYGTISNVQTQHRNNEQGELVRHG